MKLYRKHITLEEEMEYVYLFGGGREDQSAGWTARYSGPSDTEEEIILSRSSEHAGDALLLLEEAIRKEGWTLE